MRSVEQKQKKKIYINKTTPIHQTFLELSKKRKKSCRVKDKEEKKTEI